MRMTQSEYHTEVQQKIANSGHKWNRPEWLILTDGSGHKDGYGGYAGIIFQKSPRIGTPPLIAECAGGLKGTSTEQAEFLGLLFSLQQIVDYYVADQGLKSAEELLRRKLPVVHWVTDRESLALAVYKDSVTHEPVYRRKSTPALWAMYSYFEPMLDVVPIFSTREGNLVHNQVDEIASDMRVIVKEHFDIREANS